MTSTAPIGVTISYFVNSVTLFLSHLSTAATHGFNLSISAAFAAFSFVFSSFISFVMALPVFDWGFGLSGWPYISANTCSNFVRANHHELRWIYSSEPWEVRVAGLSNCAARWYSVKYLPIPSPWPLVQFLVVIGSLLAIYEWWSTFDFNSYGARILKAFKRSDSHASITHLPFFNVEEGTGTCLWQALLDLGYDQMTLVHANVYPWTTSLARADMSIFGKNRFLPLYYSMGDFGTSKPMGHVSLKPFAGSHFGFNPFWARSFDFGKEETATSSYYAPPIGALGGVKPMLTQVAATTKSANFSSIWHWGTFPTRVIERAIRWSIDPVTGSVASVRTSEYIRHHPELMARTRLPEVFTDDLHTEFLWPYAPQQNRAHVVRTTSLRNWSPHTILSRGLTDFATPIGALINGATDYESVKRAQVALAQHRFLATRGNRIIPGWEANDHVRSAQLSNYLLNATRTQDYRYIFARLWSRFLLAQLTESLNADRRRDGLPVYAFQMAATGANTPVHYISAQYTPPAIGGVPVNPEAGMWAPAAQNSLLSGDSQFIDTAGMSDAEVAELISAIDPMVADNIPFLRLNQPQPQQLWLNGLSRFQFNNPVTEIWAHNGNEQRTPASIAAIANLIHAAPNSVAIGSVIRILATTTGSIPDAEFGLEWALSRFATISSDTAQGTRDNYTRDLHVYGDGHYTADLPKMFTPAAYLHRFYIPAVMSDQIMHGLVASRHSFIQQATLLTHARAVSLNWAAYSTSMYGRVWNNAVGNEPVARIRNHIDSLRRVYGTDDLNLWSSIANNALAHQYGFGISHEIRMTEAGSIFNIWADYVSPYYRNPYLELWMVDFLPTFQLLPYHDPINHWSQVRRPSNEPTPLPTAYDFTGTVKLSRDREPFNGFAWINDGGVTSNGQFYVGQANATGGYAYEGNVKPFDLRRWRAQTAYDTPNAPAAQAIRWMAPLNTPFADFILPGSIHNFDITLGIQRAYAVHYNDELNGPNSALLRTHWTRLTQGEDMHSLMINYVHPLRDQRELDQLPDYSAIVWEDGNNFSGVSVVQHTLPDFEVDARWDSASSMIKPPLYNSAFNADPGADRAPMRRINKTSKPPGTHAAIVKPTHTKIKYESKGPNLSSELPPLDTYETHLEPEGITINLKPNTLDANSGLPTQAIDDIEARVEQYRAILEDEALRGTKINNERSRYEQAVDDDFAAYLAQQEARKRAFHAAQETRTQRYAQKASELNSHKSKPQVPVKPTFEARENSLDALMASAKKRVEAEQKRMAAQRQSNPSIAGGLSTSEFPALMSGGATPKATDTTDNTTARINRPSQNTGEVLGYIPKKVKLPTDPVVPNDAAAANVQTQAAHNTGHPAPGDNVPLPKHARPPGTSFAHVNTPDSSLTPLQGQAMSDNLSGTEQTKN
jgi:hypothetical protein